MFERTEVNEVLTALLMANGEKIVDRRRGTRAFAGFCGYLYTDEAKICLVAHRGWRVLLERNCFSQLLPDSLYGFCCTVCILDATARLDNERAPD